MFGLFLSWGVGKRNLDCFGGFYGSLTAKPVRFAKSSTPSLEVLQRLGIMDCGDDCAVIGGSMVSSLPSLRNCKFVAYWS